MSPGIATISQLALKSTLAQDLSTGVGPRGHRSNPSSLSRPKFGRDRDWSMKRHPTPAIADPSEGSHLARLEGLEPPTA